MAISSGVLDHFRGHSHILMVETWSNVQLSDSKFPAFVKLDPGLCVSGGSFGDVFLAYGSAGLSQLEFSWENHPILRHSQRPAGKAFKSQNLSQPYGWLIPALKWSHYSYTMNKHYENTPLIHYYKFK